MQTLWSSLLLNIDHVVAYRCQVSRDFDLLCRKGSCKGWGVAKMGPRHASVHSHFSRLLQHANRHYLSPIAKGYYRNLSCRGTRLRTVRATRALTAINHRSQLGCHHLSTWIIQIIFLPSIHSLLNPPDWWYNHTVPCSVSFKWVFCSSATSAWRSSNSATTLPWWLSYEFTVNYHYSYVHRLYSISRT